MCSSANRNRRGIELYMRKKAIFADIICLHSNTEPKHDVHVDNTRDIGTTF